MKATKGKTPYPIGKSGFYLPDGKIGGLKMMSCKKIAPTLWKIKLCGLGNFRSDETGSEASTVWDTVVFDSDTNGFYDGYPQRIGTNLFGIFDTQSVYVGWPADDIVVLKNVVTGRRTFVSYGGPANDGKVISKCGFHIFTSDGWVDDNNKKWMAVVDSDGKTIFKGWYKEYSFVDQELIIKRIRAGELRYAA